MEYLDIHRTGRASTSWRRCRSSISHSARPFGTGLASSRARRFLSRGESIPSAHSPYEPRSPTLSFGHADEILVEALLVDNAGLLLLELAVALGRDALLEVAPGPHGETFESGASQA